MGTIEDYAGRTVYGTVDGTPPTSATAQTLPDWKRDWYESAILETIRMKSILVPFCTVKEDFASKAAGRMTYTEIFDLESNWNPTTEDEIWFKGGSLDSRSVTIDLEMYHNVVKFSQYMPLTMYINGGDMRGLVTEKIGVDVANTMDILARNAFLTHPNPKYAGTATSRATLDAADVFDPMIGELVRTELEEDEIPGITSVEDGGGATVLCVTTPRVIHDIRTTAGNEWIDAQNYAGAAKRFTSEVGTFGGVRYIKTNRLRLRNAGATIAQTTLDGAVVPGQGAAATVDSVYKPGQTGSTRYVTVAAVTDFAVGQYVTVHHASLGTAVLDTDGSQEVRRIVSIDSGNKRLSFDKPFLKDHASGAYVTHGQNVHASLFVGGPSIVCGIAERPTILIPPVIDDAQMINRISWRAYMNFQLFRPEFYQLVYSSGSDNE